LGEKRLLWTYLAGGITGGLFYLVSFNIFPAFAQVKDISMALGASASVLAIIVATATYIPDFTVQLLLFGRVKMKYIAIAFVAIDLLSIQSGNPGGHIAHLGGAFWGFIYAYTLKNGTDLYRFLHFSFYKKPFTSQKRSKSAGNQEFKRPLSDEEYNARKIRKQQKIDAILDKISKSGYSSLTKEEKEFLEKVIQIKRVSKKTKGGNKISFSALVVVGDKKGKVGEPPHRHRPAPVHIQGVADGLESVKRDAHREEDGRDVIVGMQQGVADLRQVVARHYLQAGETVEEVDEKKGVLEIGQHTQVDEEAEGYPASLRRPVLRSIHPPPGHIVDRRGDQQKDKEKTSRFVIEEDADQEKIEVAQEKPFVYEGIEGEYHQQEDPEIHPCEQQGVVRRIAPYFLQAKGHGYTFDNLPSGL
jgi:hypothetical protein